MSSWWSALNPFVGVTAEEKQDEKKEEKPKEEGKGNFNSIQSIGQLTDHDRGRR
jgi:hypothetical protein